MGISENERDEAFSESLVAITEAAQSFDPTKGSVAGWLARNIRWSIKTWQLKQMYNWQHQIPVTVEAKDDLADRVAYNDLLRLMDKELTARQRTILLATAAGYKGKEIAAALQVGEMTIVRERRKAQTRLRELLS
jgi:RNA polymerase sigma factor (sigma-70 family)